MGSSLSCIHRGSISRQVDLPDSPAPARVIAADGSLKELPASPLVAVSDVLVGLNADTAVASSFFVCNADALYFNEPPPALAPGDLLSPGQMYFVLPADLLARPMSAADMAALAVRASAALASSCDEQRRGRRGDRSKKTVRRVMPVDEDAEGGVDLFNEKLNELTLGQVGVLLMISPGKKDDEKPAAAERSRLKSALSIIREDAE